MKYYHNQQAFELVSGTKDLNTLQKYGLTQDEIWELKGIKREGNRKVKETRVSYHHIWIIHYTNQNLTERNAGGIQGALWYRGRREFRPWHWYRRKQEDEEAKGKVCYWYFVLWDPYSNRQLSVCTIDYCGSLLLDYWIHVLHNGNIRTKQEKFLNKREWK